MKQLLVGLLAMLLIASCQTDLDIQELERPDIKNQKEFFKVLEFESTKAALSYVLENPDYSVAEKKAAQEYLMPKSNPSQNSSSFKYDFPPILDPPDRGDIDIPAGSDCSGCYMKVNRLSSRKFILSIKTPDNNWVPGSSIAIGYDVQISNEWWSDGFSSSSVVSSCSNHVLIYEPYQYICSNHSVSFFIQDNNAGSFGFWNLNNQPNFPNITSIYNCTSSNYYTYIGPSDPFYCPYD